MPTDLNQQYDHIHPQPSLLDEIHEIDEERYLWPEDLVPDLPTITLESDGKQDSERTPEEVLQRYWGYDTFREMQSEIVHSALSGYDTLGLLPTGGGKSICFQVPGLILPGITLVVTPLISLMKDQVEHLRQRGIKAAAIHSGMFASSITQTIDNCIYGGYKFLYVSPERLGSERFRQQLLHLQINLLVIDECHCICQWGYDFRPSYLNILELRSYIPQTPILALTATATPDVVQNIQSILGFRTGSKAFQKSFFRPNLSYSIRRTSDKEAMVLHILSRVSGSAIIYCRSRSLCREFAHWLRSEGISATYFHAGLTHADRDLRQTRWMRGEYRVMVATNAFGMGIDKPDVRLVIHLMMPSSIEEYFQEAGRAGRDGEQSYAVVIVGEHDGSQLERRLVDAFPEREYITHTYESVCSYLGIGEGEGLGRSFDFDLDLFTRRYHMRPVQTRSAIDIMQVAGWLRFDEQEAGSRLMFIYTRDMLYQPEVGNDQLLRAILRLYPGVFADYVSISETDLANLTGYTAEEVYGILTMLTDQGILHYIPRKNIPRLHFLIRREDSRYLTLPASAYQDRYLRLRERIEATVAYIEDEETCRSRLLLRYFGEESSISCGMCDICRRRTDHGLRHYVIEDTQRIILERLSVQESHMTLQELSHALPYTPSDVLGAVQWLIAEHLELGLTLTGNILTRSIEHNHP